MKKKIASVALFFCSASTVFANYQDIGTIKKNSYYEGVNDAIIAYDTILKQPSTFLNNKKYFNGYIVYVNSENFSQVEIVRNIAIAIRLGMFQDVSSYNIDGEKMIIFAVKNRKADAIFLSNRLKKFNIPSKVKKVNKVGKRINIIGQNSIDFIKKFFDKKIKEAVKVNNNFDKKTKEGIEVNNLNQINNVLGTNKYNNEECKKENIEYHKIDFRHLQVVNRVVTDRFLRKHHIKKARNLSPLNNYAKKHLTLREEKRKEYIVKKNIKKDYLKEIPNLKNFSKLYRYITLHGAIEKNGNLLLNGRIIRPGEKISDRWILKEAVYPTGVIVVSKNNSEYHVVK